MTKEDAASIQNMLLTRRNSLLVFSVLLTAVFTASGLIGFIVQNIEAKSSDCFVSQVQEQSQEGISNSQVDNMGNNEAVIINTSNCAELQAIIQNAEDISGSDVKNSAENSAPIKLSEFSSIGQLIEQNAEDI